MKSAGAAVFCIGLASLALLAWALRRLTSLERALDPGDFVFFGVLAAFGLFCVAMAWLVFRTPSPVAATAAPAAPSPRRVSLSHACAAAGVALLIACVLVPESWHPVAFLFAGLALLAVSHALTPCVERLEQLRKARDSVRQL